MKRSIGAIICLIILCLNVQAQIPGAINLSDLRAKNGQLDLEDFALRLQVPVTMPDGIALQTDVYLPIMQDSFAINLELPFPILGVRRINLELLPRNFQYIIYDSINGQPNPNPYQLPAIMERTPYNKKNDEVIGSVFSLMGYAGFVQDMRGRYTSEGVYLPLYSDSWKKSDYHDYTHILDLTDPDDPTNGNFHEDGHNTVEFIKNNLFRQYDLDNDGVFETTDLVYNGSLGMFGASALAYNQLQAISVQKQDPNGPGVKSLFPIVGTLEFYRSTGFQNGVLREQLVSGWLRGQLVDTDDTKMDIDFDLQNDIHSSNDYGVANKFIAANKAIDHFVTIPYEGSTPGYYPNSIGRKDMDGSRAMLNEMGQSDPNGTVSRYTNMEVPTFQVAGWWDIFIDGSLETWALQRKHVTETKKKQKIIIGPWAHQTISSRVTGDVTYPQNVKELTKIDIAELTSGEGELQLNIGEIAESELLSWFRYNLNRNNYANVGEPKIRIPESNKWQKVVNNLFVRFPAKEYRMKFVDLINFLTGADGLKQVPLSLRVNGVVIDLVLDIPSLGPLIDGFESDKFDKIPEVDFETVPDVRFYVAGPTNDPLNPTTGNYWFESDTFPLRTNIFPTTFYLHKNGDLNQTPPVSDEGFAIYVHDPDNPVYTIGGPNMIVKTPDNERDSQGQFDLKNPKYVNFTMERPDVLQFETDTLTDTISVIGFTKVKLFAKSNPQNASEGDPTDTDFFVRFVDVFPDGRELYVYEGCINARAREYAKSLAEGEENDNAPFSNIETGKVYEYTFQTLPIAYTFGVGHKIKMLVSSSNHPRYQSNPNLPMEDGQFFRRQPKDGQTYIYNGVEMEPRKAVNRIAFSPTHPSQVTFPVFGKEVVLSNKDNIFKNDFKLDIFPNPASEVVNVMANKSGDYILTFINTLGQEITSYRLNDNLSVNIKSFPKGAYFMRLSDANNPASFISKTFVIQ